MGNRASYASGATAATAASVAALHGATTGLFRVIRMKVDPILAISGFGAIGLGQIDDGTDANAKVWVRAEDNGGPKRIVFHVGSANGGGGGGIDTGWIPLTSWPAAGSEIVVYIGYDHAGFTMYCGVFDATGTNTLADGLPKATSIFWKTAPYNTTFPSIVGDGIAHANYAQGATSAATVVDGEAWLTALRTSGQEDKEPSSADAASWLYDDTIGSTSFVAQQASGVGALVASGTVTLAAGGGWGPTTATPTTVVVTAGALSISIGGVGHSTAATDDQTGAPMAGRTWSATTSNGAIATAAVVGSDVQVTGVATGTCQVTVADTATGGAGATHAVINVTVGVLFDWASTNTAVATVGTGAALENVTEAGAGTATINVTRHGTLATCAISIIASVSGSGNEPSGMTVSLNTGDLTVAPPTVAQVSAGQTTWNVGTTLISQFQISSPAVKNSTGEWAGNLVRCPDGPGYRLVYDTTLSGGFSPARFGVPLVMPAAPAGYYYQRGLYRIGGPEAVWSNVGRAGVAIAGAKLCEPKNQQGTENHVFSMQADNGRLGGAIYDNYFVFFLQGPSGQSKENPNIFYTVWSATTAYHAGDTVSLSGSSTGYLCILAHTNHTPPNATYWLAVTPKFSYFALCPEGRIPVDGAYHKPELLITPQSSPAVNDGKLDLWMDGTHILPMSIDGVQIIGAGEAQGFPFLEFDPTFGGAQPADGPAQTQNEDFNQLYISQK